MILGLVLGTFSDGTAFTSAMCDRIIAAHKNEAREIRRGLRERIDLDKVVELVALEERIDVWKAIRRPVVAVPSIAADHVGAREDGRRFDSVGRHQHTHEKETNNMGSNVNLSSAAITNAWNVLEGLRTALAMARRRGCDAIAAILEKRLAHGEQEFSLAEKRRDLLAAADVRVREAKLAMDAAIERQYDVEIGDELSPEERAEILLRRDEVDVARAIFLVRERQNKKALNAAQNPIADLVGLSLHKNPYRERAERTISALTAHALNPYFNPPEFPAASGAEERAWEEFYARSELETYDARAEERTRSLHRGGLARPTAIPKPSSWVVGELGRRGVVLGAAP